MVGAGLENAATGSGMSERKRAASMSPPKPRISSNLDGRRGRLGRAARNESDVAAGATKGADQTPTAGKKTRSGAEATSGATTAPDGGDKLPKGRVGRSSKVPAIMLPTSRLRADSEESGGDGSSKCKEAGGAQDTISHNPDDDEEEEDDDEDDGLEDVDEEDDAELILLRRAMDALEHRMFSEGTVASVFARTIAQAQLAEKTLGADALEAMEDIFHGDAEADPGAVAAALEPNAARARVYLIVMNDNVGFTLLHHLQRMDQEIRPGDPIANKIVAFEGDIRPQGPTPNVVVFDEAEDTLFQRFDLPPARLKETHDWYRSTANGNDQNNTFMVDPSISVKVVGAVTRLIPIPLEWASMFLDGPNFGTTVRRMFDLFDSLVEDQRSNLYPIFEMICMACCATDNSDMPASTLSTQWTRLTYHARTRRWAAEAWARHSGPGQQAHVDQDDPLPPETPSPSAQLKDLFGQRRKRRAGHPPGTATTRDSRAPTSPVQAAMVDTAAGDLGSIMMKILAAQSEANLRLQQNLMENFRVTSAAVGATGTTRDARLSDAKLRILQACAGHDDCGPFIPSKLYLEVDQDGGSTDTFSRVLRRLVVTVPGSAHKCNVHITPKIVLAAKTLNFSANEDMTFDGCSNGITPFATPWRTADVNNNDLADDRYFNEATLKSPADIKRHATGAKFAPPQSLQELVRVLTNYVRLLEIMFGDRCPHMQWVLRLRDALDSHERLLENRITPALMINLLWKVHQDSHQFFVRCERWEDGEPIPRSTLRATVAALEDDVHISTNLTCPVTEFLGTAATPSLKSDRQDPGAAGRYAVGHGKQPTKNPSIPPICAQAVKEVNRLYPSLDISQFSRKSGVAYSRFVIGHKGDCTNFALLGRCSEACPYKHIARPVADAKAISGQEALELGLKAMATKTPA
jgi:hypothetical protein